jgi:hypothetical protein
MLKDEIEKIPIKKDKKKTRVNWVNQTRDSSHEIKITS